MKKTMLSMVVISCAVMGSESGLYVGVYGGETRLTVKASNGTYSTEKYKEGKNAELKIGYYLDRHHRVHGFYQDSRPVSDQDGRMYGAGYDYLIGESVVKPFVGAVAGHFKVTQNGVELQDNFMGVQAGLHYILGEKFSVEAGYRYILAQGNQQTVGSTVFEADTIKNWFAGVNYKF
jgi:opacity protein-like surface antigen